MKILLFLNINFFKLDWGLGIGDWGLGIGDWVDSFESVWTRKVYLHDQGD